MFRLVFIRSFLFISCLVISYLTCDFFYYERRAPQPREVPQAENKIPDLLSKITLSGSKSTYHQNQHQHLLNLLKQEAPANIHAFFKYWRGHLPTAELPEELYTKLVSSLHQWSDQDLKTFFDQMESQSAAYFLPRLFERLAKQEPARFYALTQQLNKGTAKLESIVLKQWSQAEPEKAMNAMLRDNYISSKMNNGLTLFKNWLSQDPAAALAWYTQTASQSVDLLKFMNLPVNFSETVGQQKTPDDALQATIASINQITDVRDKALVQKNLIKSLALTDPEGARELIKSIDNESLKWSMEMEVKTAEVMQKPESIDELLYDSGLSGTKKEAVAELATTKLMKQDSEKALSWIQTIADPIARDAAHRQYAYQLIQHDIPGTLRLVRNTESEHDRQALRSGLEKMMLELNLTPHLDDLKFLIGE
jgi:hypothetical protein